MSVEDIVLAARAAKARDGVLDTDIWACEVHAEIVRQRAFVADLEAARMFVAKIMGVRRVKNENGLPGKAQVTTDQLGRDRMPESIETDWLTDPRALHIARLAQSNLGLRAVFFKANDEDPSGNVAQGYRRLVWLTVLAVQDPPTGDPQGLNSEPRSGTRRNGALRRVG